MTLLRASVVALLCACGGGGGFPDAAGEPDAAPRGTMSLTWSLVKMADGSSISCDQVGGVTVTLVLRNRAVQGGFTEVFSCATGMGTTPTVPVGTYDVRFELTGVSGEIITMGTEQMGIVVAPDQNATLSPVTFTVNAVGGLQLKLDTLKTGGNCGAIASMGAGLDEFSITLNHASGGACEPATLMIAGGPTYTINCAAPARTPCFDAATLVTASNVPSDAYVIHVRGHQPAADNCYVNDDMIRVPPNGMPLVRTLNLAASGATGCL